VLCLSLLGWELQEVKGPIPTLWVNFRTLRNIVIHGKRVVWRHLAEHDITSSSDSDRGIIVAYTWCAYDDILERIVYPAFLLTLPWPRWHPWVGRDWIICRYWWWLWFSWTYGYLSLTPEFCPWYLSVGSVYFRSPGWIWRYLFRGSGGHPFSGSFVMIVIYSPVPFISELPKLDLRLLCPSDDWNQSRDRIQYNWSLDDLEDAQWLAFMHLIIPILHSSASNPCLSIWGVHHWLRFWSRDILMSESYRWNIIRLNEARIKGQNIPHTDRHCMCESY
jgi:hypothetical protein